MDSNPVMQRVMMLSEMWASEIANHPDVRVLAWLGHSLVEYKTIKGFVMFQTAKEKTLADTVLLFEYPFVKSTNAYTESILSSMHQYITAWNNDSKLVEETGIINWEPLAQLKNETDAAHFVRNFSRFADALQITGKPEVLTVALFPQNISEFPAYTGFIESIAQTNIPATVRFMLYDSYDRMMFEKTANRYARAFTYLKPDLDMPGAMNQILENAKAEKTTDEEKDVISYQQALIRLNDAIGYSSDKDVVFYSKKCFELCHKHNWKEQEALTYFFLHNYYTSLHKTDEAHNAIDTAISITQAGIQSGTILNDQTQYQYFIAKGNLFFMNKAFDKAADTYKQCLAFDRKNASPLMLAGIYQMLANCQRKCATKTEARNSFKEGWELLYTQGEGSLKANTMAMFYANDMLEVADTEMDYRYRPLMDQLWGEGWQRNIKQQLLNEKLTS